MRYAVLGKNDISTYWTLERCTRTKVMAYFWMLFYRLYYDKTETRNFRDGYYNIKYGD